MTSSSSYKEAVNRFWQDNRPIYTSLPVTLPNGSKVTQLVGACSSCNAGLPRGMMRGVVKQSLLGYQVTAFGRCLDCNLLTPFMCEVVEDAKSWKLIQRKWKGWKAGEVVYLDFSRRPSR